MRKICLCTALMMLLSGCAAEPVYETVADVLSESQSVAAPGSIELALPDGTQMEVLSDDGASQIYRVGDWEIWTQVRQGPSIEETLEQVTGLSAESLFLISVPDEKMQSYETVWSAMGENEQLIGRAAVLDDGDYHYCISMLIPEKDAQELDELFEQICNGVTIRYTAS